MQTTANAKNNFKKNLYSLMAPGSSSICHIPLISLLHNTLIQLCCSSSFFFCPLLFPFSFSSNSCNLHQQKLILFLFLNLITFNADIRLTHGLENVFSNKGKDSRACIAKKNNKKPHNTFMRQHAEWMFISRQISVLCLCL